MDRILTYLAEPFRGKIDLVVSPEPLGFILGSMMARELGTGFVALRKGRDYFDEDKDTIFASYIDHHNNVQCLAVMKDLIPAGSHVLIVDDYIGTAATMQSCLTILEEAGASAVGIASLGACYRRVTREMIDSGMVHCICRISAEA